jgi:hypothetical protein
MYAPRRTEKSVNLPTPLPLYYFTTEMISGGVTYINLTMVVAFWHSVLQELQKLRHKQKHGCMRRAEPKKSVNLPTPLVPLYYFTTEMISGGVICTNPTMVVAFWHSVRQELQKLRHKQKLYRAMAVLTCYYYQVPPPIMLAVLASSACIDR